jgi:two-component system, chemotaxis family, chemotaxis protein CheY
LRALVVDDSRAIRAVLKRMLGELGFQTAEAGDGLQALAVLEEAGAFDIVLVDWNMPEMNGLELVKAVRAIASFESMPMLMVTTESEMERVIEALTAGASDYLMKPFTKDALLSKLEILGVAG